MLLKTQKPIARSAQRVVARRPDEREAAVQRSLDRRPGRERGRLVGRRRGERVVVEPGRVDGRAHVCDVLARVDEQQLVLGRRAAFRPAVEVLEQHREPLLPLRVVPRRMQAREIRMRQDVDRTIRSSSSSPFAPPADEPEQIAEERCIRSRPAVVSGEPREIEQALDVLGRELELLARHARLCGQRVGALRDPLVHASEASRLATVSSPSCRRREDASAHVGVWGESGGRGAEASMRRDSPEEAQILRLGREPAVGEHRVERAVLLQQVGRLLRADARARPAACPTGRRAGRSGRRPAPGRRRSARARRPGRSACRSVTPFVGWRIVTRSLTSWYASRSEVTTRTSPGPGRARRRRGSRRPRSRRLSPRRSRRRARRSAAGRAARGSTSSNSRPDWYAWKASCR